MESHRKGEFTESGVITELKRRGIPVSTPFGDNERYDIVAETPDGQFVSFQVKTGRFRDGTVRFGGESQHTNSRGHVYKQYDGDVDYFLVYCHEIEAMFLVAEDCGRKMLLRVEEPENGTAKSTGPTSTSSTSGGRRKRRTRTTRATTAPSSGRRWTASEQPERGSSEPSTRTTRAI